MKKKSLRWFFGVTLFLVAFAPPSFTGVQPICPTCGKTPTCPPDAPPDSTCGGGTLAQTSPTPTPTPTPKK